jgi:hypothetical protein
MDIHKPHRPHIKAQLLTAAFRQVNPVLGFDVLCRRYRAVIGIGNELALPRSVSFVDGILYLHVVASVFRVIRTYILNDSPHEVLAFL